MIAYLQAILSYKQEMKYKNYCFDVSASSTFLFFWKLMIVKSCTKLSVYILYCVSYRLKERTWHERLRVTVSICLFYTGSHHHSWREEQSLWKMLERKECQNILCKSSYQVNQTRKGNQSLSKKKHTSLFLFF